MSIHELAEFGLIEVTDPMPNRKTRPHPSGTEGRETLSSYEISVPMFSGMPSTDALFDLSKFDDPAIDRAISTLALQAPRFR